MNYQKHTQTIFVGSTLLTSPLGAMFSLLAFIFVKDLQASPFQIALLVSARPIVALFSFYGNLIIKGHPSRLKSFIIFVSILGFIPCFLFPFVHNIWYFIVANAFFMMSSRAVIPAWSEIFKINLLEKERGKIFSRGSSVCYLVDIFIPLLFSPLIDSYPQSWKWIFFFLAVLQCTHIALLFLIKIKSYAESDDPHQPYHLTCAKSVLWGPWKNCWTLMKQRPDFRNYQIVFMLGGAGLMFMQPILPIYFEETLKLSYTELTGAFFFCKGVSFILFSPIWAYGLTRIPIHFFNFLVTLFAGLFGLMILGASANVYWIYAAYVMYGIMQAGSTLSWHLSGPIFSKEKDSTLFSGVNVAMVGLRGCVAPFLGELLFLSTNTTIVFFGSSLLCLSGAAYSLWVNSQKENLEFGIRKKITGYSG
jgi:hypothetical protein